MPHVHLVWWFFPRGKGQGGDFDHSLPSIAEVRNAYSSGSLAQAATQMRVRGESDVRVARGFYGELDNYEKIKTFI
jgi:hypothetical protein